MTRTQFLRLLAGGTCMALGLLPLPGPSDVAGSPESAEMPIREHPLVIDEKRKRLLLYCEVNGRGLASSNPHWGVVFRGGKLHDRAILKAYARPEDFHDALLRLGARPGNNMTDESYGIAVAGEVLAVRATWPGLGKELMLADIFSDESGKGFQIRFGGNRQASVDEATGCITCLESCWVGVTSNARYPHISSLRRAINPNSRFQGRSTALPADGKPVMLIYRVAAA